MEKDDPNFDLMCSERAAYMDVVFQEAKENCVVITEWEVDEIELAFENGFCKGVIACEHKRKIGDLN